MVTVRPEVLRGKLTTLPTLLGQRKKSEVKANPGFSIQCFISELKLCLLWGRKTTHDRILNLMFSWSCSPLAVVSGLHNYGACEVPSHVSIGQSGRTWHCAGDGSHWGEGSNCFPDSIVTIQQGKKVPESQTPQEEIDKHSVFLTSLQAGIWRTQWSFQSSRSKGVCGNGQTQEAWASFWLGVVPPQQRELLLYLTF